MTFAKSYKALRAYKAKALNDAAYQHVIDGTHCVLGALVPETRAIVDGTSICRLAEISPSVRRGLRRLGLTVRQASVLQTVNDTFEGTNAARYEYVLAHLRRRVRENRAVQQARKAAKAAAR